MGFLTPDECFRLLRDVSLGRVVFTDQALPAVEPVRFVVAGDSVIARAPAGSALGAGNRPVVAFEADEIDVHGQGGWMVTGVGRAEIIRPDDLAFSPPACWDATRVGLDGHLVHIRLRVVSGRWFGSSALARGSPEEKQEHSSPWLAKRSALIHGLPS
jgi:hypothetical protein